MTIQSHGCGHCATCPHLAAGKSPLNLGLRRAVSTDIALPANQALVGGVYAPDEALSIMNSKFFVAPRGGETRIFRQHENGSLEAFKKDSFRKNAVCQRVRHDFKRKARQYHNWWLVQPERRTIENFVFKPTGAVSRDEYNLWRGFAVQPLPGLKKARKFLRHIRQVICRRENKITRESRVLPGLRSGGEPECLHFIGVLSFGDEFREDVAWSGIQEKFRQALAQGVGHDQLRGRDAGPDGAQPGAEGVPDTLREGDGQVLKQSLADDGCLDEDVVSVQLAPDGVAVFGRGAMEMLVAAAAARRLHVGHPEVVGERADQPHRLLEAYVRS